MAVDSETTEIRALQVAKTVRGEIGFAGLRLNGRLRDERPNRNAFTLLTVARRIIEACDYNLAALAGYRSPSTPTV